MKKQLLNLFIATSFCSLFIAPSSSFAQVPNYVPTNGLIGYWPFNGNANDESGNGNNGTVNGATLTSDRNGISNSAYNFSGSTVLIPLTQQMVGMPERTISLWFNSANGQSGGRLFEATNISGGVGCYNSNVFDCWCQKSNQAYNFVGETFQNHNQWYNLIYICDSTNQFKKLYLNGTLINSGSPAANPGNPSNWVNQYIKIGLGNANEAFYGKIDDIGIWNRALTQCEIQDIYHAQLNSAAGISAGPDQTVCEGEFITFNGSGGTNYVWNNSVMDGVPFIPTASMDYPVLGQDANGCIGTDTMHVELIPTSSSTLTETALDSYTLNGQTYTQSGTYTQVIPNAAGCDSTITLNLSLDFTGINETQTGFTIAPNPTMDFVTITSTDALYDNYVLFDPQGRKVLSGTLTGTTTQLDLSKLARGNYLLQIGEKKTPIRLIKQ